MKKMLITIIYLMFIMQGCETGSPKKVEDSTTENNTNHFIENFTDFADDSSDQMANERPYISPKQRIERLVGEDFITMYYTKDQTGVFVLRRQPRWMKDLEFYIIDYDSVSYDHTVATFPRETQLKCLFPLANDKMTYITVDNLEPTGNAKLVVYDYKDQREIGMASLMRFYNMDSAHLSSDEDYIFTSDIFYFIDISDLYNPKEAPEHNGY